MTPKAKQHAKTQKKPGGVATPFQVAAVWPHQECPLILSMVGGRQIFIATSFSPVTWESIASRKINNWRDDSLDPSLATSLPRWLALVPYETFSDIQELQNSTTDRLLAWEIHGGLVWDNHNEQPRYVSKPDASAARFHLEPKLRLPDVLTDAAKINLPSPKGLKLQPSTSNETYTDSVRSLIRDIQAGKFYQINLLRYFHASTALGWDNLCSLMASNSGPHGVLISIGNRVVASFSPERFIEIQQQSGHAQISTWPIKGTAPRDMSDEVVDTAIGKKLDSSIKDRAELHMIIDLMRNDFAQICRSGSVNVIDSGSLKNFFQVWHLEGAVTGVLNDNLTLNSILKAICPGGSITGAPKLAAMRQIALEEGRPRGYFMGNFVRINHDGSLQSNIMIRTLVSENMMRSASYAAGSGIVIKSDPQLELQEIHAKCAPITLTSSQDAKKIIQQDLED